MFAQAQSDDRTGLACNTKPVDVRPAQVGEIVVTIIKGEGQETKSPPAERGDKVVRNRCRGLLGNEEILVPARKFAERYAGPIGPLRKGGWRAYRPRGVERPNSTSCRKTLPRSRSLRPGVRRW